MTVAWIVAAALTCAGALGVVTALVVRRRWLAWESDLEAELVAAARPFGPSRAGDAAGATRAAPDDGWSDLPSDVRRWLERSGAMDSGGANRALIVSLRQACEIRLSERSDAWTPFVASELVSAVPPAFTWRARTTPEVPPLRVVDAFVGGHGVLRASIAGVIPVLDAPPGRALDAAELLRWLAEVPWFPEAARPGGPVRWRMKDGRVQGLVTGGAVTVGAFFDFDGAGDVVAVETPRRPRLVGDGTVPTPWRGAWSEPGDVDGLRLPRHAEVAWLIDGTERPYWRGRLLTRSRRDAPQAREVGDGASGRHAEA